MSYETRYCTHCATALAPIVVIEDSGEKERLRCPACGWTHWNNPTPVLAAIVESWHYRENLDAAMVHGRKRALDNAPD